MSYRTPITDSRVVPLTERTGSPRSDEDKLTQIVEAAVLSATEKSNGALIVELRGVVQRLEAGIERLASSLEAFVSGDQDIAVASLVEGACDDLPSIPRIKAEAASVYTMSARDIGEAFGLTWSQVSQILNQNGMDWGSRKPDLWSAALYKKTKRRLWHPKVVDDRVPGRGV